MHWSALCYELTLVARANAFAEVYHQVAIMQLNLIGRLDFVIYQDYVVPVLALCLSCRLAVNPRRNARVMPTIK